MMRFLKGLKVSTKDLYSEPMNPLTQATANAVESVTFTLPTDQLLYGIDLKVQKSNDLSLFDGIGEIELKLDGAKVVRNLSGKMLKTTALLDRFKCSTGFYKLLIAHPEIGADPIPLNQFSSCTLKVTTVAAGGTDKNIITPVLQMGARSSYPALGDIGMGKVLVETFLPQVAYGANTGEQVYDHMRTNNILGYIYELGDNGTLSDTAFDYLTLQLKSKNGILTPYNKLPLAHLKEMNTQDTIGNALAAGLYHLPFPDGLRTGDFTTVRSLLNIKVAGTNAQAKVLERYMLGGT